MNIRKNIYSLTPQELADFQDALNAIKADGSYDGFVHRHHHAMMTATPMPGEPLDSIARNVAHSGPAFLPWHRYFCRELELLLQSKKKTVTLPYWDWAADAADPLAAPLWNGDPAAGPVYVGGDGDGPNGEVTTGPFARWTALIADLETGGLLPRKGITRALGGSFPTADQVEDMISDRDTYDEAPWSRDSRDSFRNRSEGWPGSNDPGEQGSQLHNRVHLWVGGDMGPGTSPNDPVFFLHHCNVDRLWARWQHTHPTAPYAPVSDGPAGHNLGDTMQHLVTADATPTRSLDYRRTLGFVYDTDPPLVEPVSSAVHFRNVEVRRTVWRAVVFRVRAGAPVHLEVVPGSGLSAPYGLTALGGSVTHTPTVDSAPFDLVQVWMAFTGEATPGPAAGGGVQIRCVETGEVFDIVLSGNTVRRQTSGVVFALDKSASMGAPLGSGLTAVQLVREAAAQGVELIRDNSGAGVVTFDQDGHPVVKLAPFGPGLSQREDVLAAIGSLEPSGNTSIGDGVETADKTLDQAWQPQGRTFNSWVMVVLTDGMENQPKFLHEAGLTRGWRTFAIGLGAAHPASAPTLTRLTSGTGGRLLLTDTPGSDTDSRFRVATYVHEALALAADDDVAASSSGIVAPSEEVRIPFQLTEADIEATVVLLVDAPTVNLTLETPTGQMLAASDLVALGATATQGTGMTFCRFELPLLVGVGAHGGTWHVRLRADADALREETGKLRTVSEDDPARLADLDALVAHGPGYHVTVNSRSNLKFHARITQSSMEPGSTVRFDAVLTEFGRPVEGRAEVVAEIRRPDGVLMTTSLDEELPGAFTGELTTAMAGVWRVRIKATGHTFGRTRFTREQLLSVAVLAGGDSPPAPVVGSDDLAEG